MIGWCGCLDWFRVATPFFCASCHAEKVAENFGFTTIVRYANIVSKKERRSLQPPDIPQGRKKMNVNKVANSLKSVPEVISVDVLNEHIFNGYTSKI